MQTHEIERIVSEDLGVGSEEAKVSILVVRYLAENKGSLVHLTPGSFIAKFREKEPINGQTLMRALQYLSGDRVHLLDVGYEFITDEEECLEIDPETVMRAEQLGYIPDPETGEPVHDYKKKVFMYFSAAAAN